jgi:hypothetical protein
MKNEAPHLAICSALISLPSSCVQISLKKLHLYFLNVRYQISYPAETIGKALIVFIYIYIYV